MDTLNLRGRVALVTGAARGIGAAVARRLAGAGASVVLADLDEGGAHLLADELSARAVRADVTSDEDLERAVTLAVEAFGGLDIVHLNAGVTSGCGVGDDFDLARYRRTMAVNVDGVVLGIHAALPALRARGGGHIVVTSSLAGLVGLTSDPLYAASKHAVVGLVRSLAGLAGEQVFVNALCPGFTDTALVDDIRSVLDRQGVPLLGADEVADAVMAVLAEPAGGRCWFVQHGRPSEPFRFGNLPGPR